MAEEPEVASLLCIRLEPKREDGSHEVRYEIYGPLGRRSCGYVAHLLMHVARRLTEGETVQAAEQTEPAAEVGDAEASE